MSQDGQEGIESIKKKVFKHPNAVTLNIERVPKDTVEVFKKYANEEFVGDYGMALKKLVDTLLVEPDPLIQIHQVLSNHEERILKLEGHGVSETSEVSSVRVRKTLSGRKIEIPVKERIIRRELPKKEEEKNGQ